MEVVFLAEDDPMETLRMLHASASASHFDSLSPVDRAVAERDVAAHGDPRTTVRFDVLPDGVVQGVTSPAFMVPRASLGVDVGAPPRDIAIAFATRFVRLWKADTSSLVDLRVSVEATPDAVGVGGWRVDLTQMARGVPVEGATLRVLVDGATGAVRGFTGTLADLRPVASTTPTVDAPTASSVVALADGELLGDTRLVVWGGDHTGGGARLSWEVSVMQDGGVLRQEYVDAATGEPLATRPIARALMRRSLWDLRALAGYHYLTCQKWMTSYPLTLCPSSCTACNSNPVDCALCACEAASGDPSGCAAQIWRYDGVGPLASCAANGDPIGEGACGVDATRLWGDLSRAYNYWSVTYGRDSWNATGAWMFGKVRDDSTAYGGIAHRIDVNHDGTLDTAWVTIQENPDRQESESILLHGHELGHVLQFGTELDNGLGFWSQGYQNDESNADFHSFAYAGLPLGGLPPASEGYRCGLAQLNHYTDYNTANVGQQNKFISTCNAWLISQNTGAPITHYGVTVPALPAATAQATYEQIAYRTLDVYWQTTGTMSTWWNQELSSAYDLHGFTAPYYTTQAAGDAIGRWTGLGGVGSSVALADRFASVSFPGSTRSPCVFYRPTAGGNQIVYQCYNAGYWTAATNFNNVAVDPTTTEPAVSMRYELGSNVAYVFWVGTGSRIYYRRFDPATFTIGASANFGASVLAQGALAAAPVYESGSYDRVVVVVYHPSTSSTSYSWTYLGSATGTAMGATYNSDTPPALVGYPYYDRIYFLRGDAAASATPRHIKYASYVLSGGWSTMQDITPLWASDTFVVPNVVRTDRGVSLASYGRTQQRLRMSYVTMGDGTGGARQLWYVTLRENPSMPGTLQTDAYRPVPMAALGASTPSSSGGLGVMGAGYPLVHFWATPKIYEWRTFSD